MVSSSLSSVSGAGTEWLSAATITSIVYWQNDRLGGGGRGHSSSVGARGLGFRDRAPGEIGAGLPAAGTGASSHGPALGRVSRLRMTIVEAGRALRERKVSVAELTREALDAVARANSRLNAFITITEETALKRAAELDEDLARGIDHGP